MCELTYKGRGDDYPVVIELYCADCQVRTPRDVFSGMPVTSRILLIAARRTINGLSATGPAVVAGVLTRRAADRNVILRRATGCGFLRCSSSTGDFDFLKHGNFD